MQIIAPDILAEARGLSIGVCITAWLVGLCLWVTGWWGHRFWTVLTITATAGIVGLFPTSMHNMKPLMASLLLAFSAGVLALVLVRLIVFALVGGVVYLTIHALAPPAWDEPLGWFLVGGMVGLLLFRLCLMGLTSGAGTLLMVYSCLCFLERVGKLDAMNVAETRTTLLNGICSGMIVTGVAVQIYVERRQKRKKGAKAEASSGGDKEKAASTSKPPGLKQAG